MKAEYAAFDHLVVSEEILKRPDSNKASGVELCNSLDEITKKFLNDMHDGSSTSDKQDRKKLGQMYESSIEVATRRISSAYDDNILDVKTYNKWAKHVKIIASFAA